MRGLRSQLLLDARVAWKGGFVAVTLGMALLFGLLLRFAVPEQLTLEDDRYVYDETGLSAEQGGGLADGPEFSSAQQVRDRLLKGGQGVGILLTGGTSAPSATLILQGYESQECPDAARILSGGAEAVGALRTQRCPGRTGLRRRSER